MANHTIEYKAWNTERRGVYGETVLHQDKWPCLLITGCCETALDDPDDIWFAEFDKLNLTYQVTTPWGSYPLSEEEATWTAEDSDAFQDGSYAFWTLASMHVWKGRKWLSPYVEYDATYNDGNYDAHGADAEAELDRLNELAVKHLAFIQEAFATLPFDTHIEVYSDDPNTPLTDPTGTDGYRLYLDLEAAMKHFGTWHVYRTWLADSIGFHIIEESPV